MYRFGPRDIGRIVDDAVELYRANARTILVTSALTLFPAALLAAVAQVFYLRGLMALPSMFSAETGAPDASFDRLQLIYLAMTAVAPVYLVVRRYYEASLLSAAPAWLTGGAGPSEPRDFLRGGRSRFFMMLLVAFVVGIITQFGTLLFIVPGILAAVALSLATTIVVVEGASFETALRRSMTLTRGRYLRVILFWFGVAVVAFALESAVNSPAGLRQVFDAVRSPESIFQELSVGWKVAEGILAAASAALVLPLAQLAWFLFYIDLRCRAEGMDLVARAHEIAAALPVRAETP